VHFLNKALFNDRNFVLSTIMFFALGFVLLPTLASLMLEDLLNYPVDTTGYMTIPRGIALVGALVLMSFDRPANAARPQRAPGMVRLSGNPGGSDRLGAGILSLHTFRHELTTGTLMPALTKAAFSRLDPKFRPEGTALFNLSRLYGSTIGIAVVQIFFYDNTQAMHLALAKDLTPYRAAAHVTGSIARPGLAALNDMITGQAAFVGSSTNSR